MSFHLGELCRKCRTGASIEGNVDNFGGTHFVINFYNGRTLRFACAEEIKYANVMCGEEGMKVVVCLTDGSEWDHSSTPNDLPEQKQTLPHSRATGYNALCIVSYWSKRLDGQ